MKIQDFLALNHMIVYLNATIAPVAIRSVLEKPARWMYPFERYMKVLKGYVQNRTRPEGCIAERQHMIHIKTAYPKFRKRTKWLQDKHNSTFIQWLRFKVQSELEEDNNGVSENLRWLAAGPNMAVPLYRSYLIKGFGHKTISAKNTGSRLHH
ncbi:hypothetical protein Prudu_009399 [Prunus dulcis]|uniref:DUF4218 domain-containing protein n=1 Tax=Prunus dulcis TaxID=3755 RepID=A0A4Y1R649_PRUDU|nr:hypothetical protein Prudu_009399 [Prunus dulcis]